MAVPTSKEESKRKVEDLVQRFGENEREYATSSSAYNETQARTEFITPLLETLGWDVHNDRALPLEFREVIEEATVTTGDDDGIVSRKPDYELRLARQRKFFVEAKKPSVSIASDARASFQVRRYGFSASLPISVLTNFAHLAVYDCLSAPQEGEDAHVARISLYSYRDYVARFDDLYDTISRQAVFSGLFDDVYGVSVVREGTEQFDGFFLNQVRSWRLRLAQDIKSLNPTIDLETLTYVVQLLISRLVFLRICEDRAIEKYETLKDVGAENTWDGLKSLLQNADRKYDSGLFRLLDDPTLGLTFNDGVLYAIISELYFPHSPYTFSVVETNVLWEIYELFLGEELAVDERGDLFVQERPEIRAAGGVYTTPQFVVDRIVDIAIGNALTGKSPSELEAFHLIDISCGSGVFLISAYQRLLSHHLEWYLRDGVDEHNGREVYQIAGGHWQLTLNEKRRILVNSVFGVDVDSQAIEVAMFSLLIKMIEGETEAAIESYVATMSTPALPSLDRNIQCGNSLVDPKSFGRFSPTASADLLRQINPFDWKDGFPDIIEQGGFDAIIGNPPYVRIQTLVAYSREEVDFYKSNAAPYSVSKQDNFDKYSLFVERGLQLLSERGHLCYIVPHKFLTIRHGQSLRGLLARNAYLHSLTHFGSLQVFGDQSSNYTCILSLIKSGCESAEIEKVRNLSRWRYGERGGIDSISTSELTDAPWTFVSPDAQPVFDRIDATTDYRLDDVADIYVGVQTSADDVYIVQSSGETDETVTFRDKDDREWTIERSILLPCLHDISLASFDKPRANKFMIFPYYVHFGRAVLIVPSEMENKFKRTWAYLNAFKATLSQRSIVGGKAGNEQWYQFGRSQSLTKFDGQPKIILPILSLVARYAYDDANIVVTGGGNGPYYLVRPKKGTKFSIYFLLAVLCHPLSEAKVRTRTSVFRGGYYSHGKQFIRSLRIPNLDFDDGDDQAAHDEIKRLVMRVIGRKEEMRGSLTPHQRETIRREIRTMRRQIEQKVSRLFDLTVDELAAIDSVEIPA